MDDPGYNAPSFGPTSEFDPTQYQNQLGFYQTYDPNATVTGNWIPPTYSGGDAPALTAQGYWSPQYNYNQSLVPQIGGTAFSNEQRQFLQPLTNQAFGDSRNLMNPNLYNPNMIYNDPVYGQLTDVRNINPDPSFDWIGTLGPAAVSFISGGLGAPLLASSLAGAGFNVARGVSEGQGWGDILRNTAISAGASYLGNSLGSYIGGETGSPFLGRVASGLTSGAAKYGANYLLNGMGGSPVSAAQQSQGNNNMTTGGGLVYPNNYTVPDYTETINVVGQREDDPWGFQGEIPSTGFPPGFDGSVGNPISNGQDAYNRTMLFGSALNDYYSSGQYMDMVNRYAPQMNPFGSQRNYYQSILRNSYANPEEYLNNPAHRAIQDRQMGSISSKLAASGYMGSGKEMADLADYLATSDNQYLDEEQRRLADLAGAGIGPSAAAGLIQTGIMGSIASRNNALANAARAFNPQTGPSTVINNNNGGGSGGPAGAANPLGNVGGLDLNRVLSLYPNATTSRDQFGNTVLSVAGRAIGFLSPNGQVTPYSPGMSGELDNSPGAGVLDPNTGLPWGQEAGTWDSNITPNEWVSGFDVPTQDYGDFGWIFGTSEGE
jgi:hypothetical protein